MNDVLSHPLGLLLWTLSLVDESLSGNQHNITCQGAPTEYDCSRHDLTAAVVQRIRGNQKTFNEVAGRMISVFFSVVLEVYRYN